MIPCFRKKHIRSRGIALKTLSCLIPRRGRSSLVEKNDDFRMVKYAPYYVPLENALGG